MVITIEDTHVVVILSWITNDAWIARDEVMDDDLHLVNLVNPTCY